MKGYELVLTQEPEEIYGFIVHAGGCRVFVELFSWKKIELTGWRNGFPNLTKVPTTIRHNVIK